MARPKLWNRGGEARRGWRALTAAARLVDPDAIVWRGVLNSSLPSKGCKCLASRWGILSMCGLTFRNSSAAHRQLFERIPAIPGLQGAWLVLVFCASSRTSYLLRVVPPDCAEDFATANDDVMRRCLSQLLGCDVSDTSWDVAELLFSVGGLGLRSARRVSPAAYWADSLRTVTAALTDQVHGHHLQAAVASRQRLLDVGFGPTCKQGHSPGRMILKMPSLVRRNTDGNVELLRNWRIASSVVHCGLTSSLASRALFRSQGGPMAGLPYLLRAHGAPFPF